MLSSALLLLVSHAGVQAESTPKERFEDFMKAMGRKYESAEEEAKRFEIFTENLGHILEMKLLDAGAEYHHISPFADWSKEEFNARNSLILPKKLLQYNMADISNTSDLPDAFDWVEKGAVNGVKNQGQCGSCWAFSTVANVEGVNFVKTGKLVSLSEQELVDCDKNYPDPDSGDQGCNGGLPANAMGNMAKNHIGLEAEIKYPYTGSDRKKCSAQKSDEIVFISSYLLVKPDEDVMAAALVQHGPLSIGLNAGPMQWYMGGIADPPTIICSPKAIDHGVAIVGYGVGKRLFSDTKYWKIRNSWGEMWGEKGYYRIIRGVNKCGLNSMVTTAVMNTSSIVV